MEMIKRTGASLYGKLSIIIFSVLLTGFGGALMMAYNFRQVGKQKYSLRVVLLMIIGAAILRELAQVAFSSSLLTLIVPNLVSGLVLAYPVWDMYFSEVDTYNERPVWIPLIAVV